MRTTRMKRSTGRRRGIASLEFVMSFPILVLLIAMLYTVYIATALKSQLTMEVRHKAWLVRSAPVKNKSLPFGITKAHSSGESKVELTRKVKVYRNWYPNVPREIKWGNVVLTGSWDHRQVKFSDGFVSTPHFGVLSQMVAAQGGVNASAGDIGGLGNIFNIPIR